MPYVKIEIREGWSRELKAALLQAVDTALVQVLGVPPGDSFVRIAPFAADDVVVPGHHGERFTFVQVQLFSGRSLDTKKRLYRELTSRLTTLGIPAEDVTVMLQEVPLDNWGIQGGQAASDLVFPFAINT